MAQKKKTNEGGGGGGGDAAVVEELERRVRAANEAYHERGEPVMDDEAFDALLDELARRAPDHPLAKRTEGAGVGAAPAVVDGRDFGGGRQKKGDGGRKERRAAAATTADTAPDTYMHPVDLPHPMGSLAKIKDTDPEALHRWAAAHRASQYVVSDKLDGVSALLHVSPATTGAVQLFTRGDGLRGRDVSYLVPHIGGLGGEVSSRGSSSGASSGASRLRSEILLLLDGRRRGGGEQGAKRKKASSSYPLPPPSHHHREAAAAAVSVRGELIIPREAYARHLSARGPARNLVAGVVNAKRSDLSVLRHVRFVPYEVVEPAGLSPGRQLELLQHAFGPGPVVWNARLSPGDLKVDVLVDLLRRRRAHSPYEVDGLVLAQDVATTAVAGDDAATAPMMRAVAFKSRRDDNIAAVAVDRVEWSVSKDGLLKPVVHFAEAVLLSGAEVRKATGFNAGYVAGAQVGPGAVVRVTRSGEVIPHILEVLSPAPRGPQLPDPERFGAWEWTPTGVDARLDLGGRKAVSPSTAHTAHTTHITHTTHAAAPDKCGAEAELQAKLLEHFLRELGVKGVSEGAVAKLCSADIDTPGKLMHAPLDDIARVPGFGPGTTDLVWSELRRVAPRDDRSGLVTVGDCLRLMKASNAFGAGFGTRKLKAILATDPGARVAAKMLMVVPSSSSSSSPGSSTASAAATAVADAASAEEIAEATPGVQRTTADAFLQGAERFRAFLTDNRVRCGREGVDHLLRSARARPRNNKAGEDEIVVALSGFRDAALERAVEDAGGRVTGSVSRRTDAVVVPDVGKGSPPPPSTTKSKIAESIGVPIMTASEFVRRFLDEEEEEEEEEDDVSSSSSSSSSDTP